MNRLSQYFLLLLLSLSGCPQSGPGEMDALPQADSAATLDQAAPSVCPPPGPFGTAVGELMDDLSFTDTLGTTLTLHTLCGEPVILLYNYYAW